MFIIHELEVIGKVSYIMVRVLLTGIFLLFSRACQCEQQLDVLKISNVPFPYSEVPAGLINAGYTQDIAEFTLCYRVMVESYNDAHVSLIVAWKPSIEDYSGDFQEASYFAEVTEYLSGFDIDGLQSSTNFLFRDIPDGGIGNRSMPVWHHEVLPRFIEPGQWIHFCIAYSSLEHILYRYQDGHKVFSYQYTDKVVTPFPSTLFDNLSFGTNLRGLITDINIYSSFFTEKDMKTWTTSCNHDDGDIFAWAPNKVIMIKADDGKKLSFIKLDQSEVCPDPNEMREKQKPIKSTEGNGKKIFQPKAKIHKTFVGLVLEFIEHNVLKDIEEAKDMCFRLNGELMTVPQNEEEEIIMGKIVDEFILKKVSNNQTYLNENQFKMLFWLAGESVGEDMDMYTSPREQAYALNGESTYFHPITGVKLNPIKPMMRPDYSTNPMFRKQCVRCFNGMNNRDSSDFWWWKKTTWCLPTICSQLNVAGPICQFEKEPTFKLRGLCKDALMDTQYKLASPEPLDLSKSALYHDYEYRGKHIRGFVGPKGWVISRNKTNDKWMMTHYHYTDNTLTMMNKNNLPFGRHKWRIENNICNEGKTNLETLQLSACPEGGFTCDDGKCLDISQRCNNIEVRKIPNKKFNYFVSNIRMILKNYFIS